MELHVWDGELSWGVPSMDLTSLQMLLYVKFSAAPVTIVKCMNPYSAPGRQLPVFQCSDGIYTDFDSMTNYLRRKNYCCDNDLSPRECADVIAYQHLLKEKLYPALVYFWWVEPSNYEGVIHSWYYSHMRFPYKLWVPSNKHKHSLKFIEALNDSSDEMEANVTEIIKHAQECLTMIANRLGEREYFFGKTPTAMDAILVSYLTMLLKVDLKLATLQNHIKACSNLTKYVQKVLQRYFPNESKSSGKSSTNNTSNLDEDLPRGRNILICGLVAAAANIAYAVATGIVQVDMKDKSADDGDDYEMELDEE